MNDVHRSHCKPCAVHHTGDVTVQGDVSEIVLGSFDFLGVFFVEVAKLLDVRMLENGIAVEGYFGVESNNIAGFVSDQRVDLDKHGILFPEKLVKSGKDTSKLLDLLAF